MVEEFAAQATLSIVIPAYRSQTLDVVLESVRELQAEVVVVDSSPSELPELSEKADVCRLPQRTPPGEARNIGAKRTRTDFILFLDSDVKLTETSRTFIRNQLARPEYDVVCGVYRTDPQVNGPIAALQNSVLRYRLLRNAHNRDAFGSASHLLIRRETFEQVGGFNPALMLYEDDEFSARSTRLGFPITVDGGFEAVHLKRFSVRSLIKDYWVLFLVAYSVVAWPVPMSIVEAVVDSVVGRHIWLFQWTHENSIPMIGTLILLFLLFSLHDPERLAVSDQIESP